MLTHGTVAQQNAKIAAVGLTAAFTVVVTAEELGFAKPDPPAYAETCRRIGLSPAEVLHIGDRHDLDVVAARAAGVSALHLDRLGEHVEPAEGRIRDLSELLRRLDG